MLHADGIENYENLKEIFSYLFCIIYYLELGKGQEKKRSKEIGEVLSYDWSYFYYE